MAAARRLAPSRPADPPPRVLVAEDDELVAMTLEDLLVEAGFAVLLAADGQAALEIAAEQPFDLLLTDLRMPRLDGETLIRRLRRDRPELPVVILSGTVPAGGFPALEIGPGPLVVLHKPTEPARLVEALRQAAAGLPS